MAAPYPFYERPPQSRDDVDAYIRSWLQALAPSPVVVHGGVSWRQTFGFRRGFCTHGVYESPAGIAFHVGEAGDMQHFPNFGSYASFDEMVDGVVRRYCGIWKLPL